MTVHKPNSLGKSERLKSRKQIDFLFSSGKKISQFPFRLLYGMESGTGNLRAGFTVSSRNFPRAVDRNRIKRLTREAYRLQKRELETVMEKTESTLHLFFIYTGREVISYEETSLGVKQALDKLIKVIHEGNSQNT